MIRRGSVKARKSFNVKYFLSVFFTTLAYISLAISLIFILVGFDREGWDVLSSAAFWTVINSFWIGSLLLFYFSERIR